MIHFIKNTPHQLLDFIKDDPVRPDLPMEFRVTDGRLVAALVIDGKPDAIACVSFHDVVPHNVEALRSTAVRDNPIIAVFYTIWSYQAGAGATLLLSTVTEIKEQFPSVTRFVTLSPKTQLARRFHLKNGATILRENEETINYEYA